ncbi:MAG: 3-phosphoshikimate 1-carboxyvinyltransferase [Mangrovibacterium sp.]
MSYLISRANKSLDTRIALPASKSISNRVLVISALCDHPFLIRNLSDSDDTRAMQKVFRSSGNVFDIGHAGTTMRFLTAFLSRIVGEWILTGSDRMKQRPIRILVNALRELGALIDYTEREGFPPLRIRGSHLKGKSLELEGSISSQYISALLLIAPVIEGGLTLRLRGEVTSRSYIFMTLKMMEHFGIRHSWKGPDICIPEQEYQPSPYTVEADWSAASYWYEILALAGKGEVALNNLQFPGLQGDSVQAGWFEAFGIRSRVTAKGIIISRNTDQAPDFLKLDLIENPDLAQTMAVLCVMKKIPFHFSGLSTLKIKETDRIAALCRELAKFGARLEEPASGELGWDGCFPHPSAQVPVISTYHDHRMALAFAPAALNGQVIIEDPMVVTKSYPGYYEDLKKAGFTVEKTNS